MKKILKKDIFKQKEIKETGADSSGSFEGPLFGSSKKSIVKRKISSIPNFTVSEQKGEYSEATTADVSAAGAYDVPFGGGPKGRRDPLKIDGPKSIYKNRAVKDRRDWPSTTTRSPALSPEAITDLSPTVRATFTGRNCALPASSSTHTKSPSCPVWTATEGTSTAPVCTYTSSVTGMNCPGHRRLSSFGKRALSVTVPVV